MRKKMLSGHIFLAIALLGVVSCNKKEETSVMSKTEEAKKQDNAAILASLTKEQQAAVRVLVRDTLVTDPQILLEAQQAFEAQQTRMLNENASKAFSSIISDASELSFGPKDAKVTLVEFFDYKCGFCHAANPWMVSYMKTHPNVRYIFKELPILSANSLIAAKAAYASKAQGKYVEFHNALMQAQGDLSTDQIIQIATSVGLDTVKLQKDMQNPEIEKYLKKVQDQASQAGISGTPGFLVNGKLISGFKVEELEAALGAEDAGK
ncbi:DsbA family protein [Pseudaquidulcibacter saccharophilus]|uniref:DsbA family protein n=1 Tax=Pseudaquidulcibacter saccharophilus TaxID=2831900 RepID=UPI001EFEF5BA|nr:DsbA family protein [Pseudaquidulcibacter saccharophilus]